MDINITLLGEMITFGVLIFVTLKYIWPPLLQAMADRQKQIASGLEASDRGKHDLELAQQKATDMLRQARGNAEKIVATANHNGTDIIEQSKDAARLEGERILTGTRAQIEREIKTTREALKGEIANLALLAASKILNETLPNDKGMQQKILADAARQIE